MVSIRFFFFSLQSWDLWPCGLKTSRNKSSSPPAAGEELIRLKSSASWKVKKKSRYCTFEVDASLLTKQSWARDNTVATARPVFRPQSCYCNLWFLSRHRDVNIFRFFSTPSCPRGSYTLSHRNKIVACPALLASIIILENNFGKKFLLLCMYKVGQT